MDLRTRHVSPGALVKKWSLERSTDLAGFLAWLKKAGERMHNMATGEFTGFDNLITVTGSTVQMTVAPEQLVVLSAASASAKINPWVGY
jgi:hypothetical protein